MKKNLPRVVCKPGHMAFRVFKHSQSWQGIFIMPKDIGKREFTMNYQTMYILHAR